MVNTTTAMTRAAAASPIASANANRMRERRAPGTHSFSFSPGSRSRSRRKIASKFSDGTLLTPSHANQRLRDRRRDGASPDLEQARDLQLRHTEVVLSDDHRALPFGQELEQPACLEAIEKRRDLVRSSGRPQRFGEP